MPQLPASDAVRPEAKGHDDTKLVVEDELSDAPLEDDVMDGDTDEDDDDR